MGSLFHLPVHGDESKAWQPELVAAGYGTSQREGREC